MKIVASAVFFLPLLCYMVCFESNESFHLHTFVQTSLSQNYFYLVRTTIYPSHHHIRIQLRAKFTYLQCLLWLSTLPYVWINSYQSICLLKNLFSSLIQYTHVRSQASKRVGMWLCMPNTTTKKQCPNKVLLAVPDITLLVEWFTSLLCLVSINIWIQQIHSKSYVWCLCVCGWSCFRPNKGRLS